MLAANPRLPVVVLAVWVKILDGDREDRLPAATSLLHDGRVVHFWDAEGAAAWRFAALLPMTRPRRAWDVYLVYRPGQRWGERPDFWMHQLTGNTTAPWLDGSHLGRVLRAVAPRRERAEAPRRQPAAPSAGPPARHLQRRLDTPSSPE